MEEGGGGAGDQHERMRVSSIVNYVCLRQGVQADKRVIRQCRQGVVVKLEAPVGEEGDTRSDAHPSTPAQHECMRLSSSKRWKRAGEGQVNPGAQD